jgi:hypothetical protein
MFNFAIIDTDRQRENMDFFFNTLKGKSPLLGGGSLSVKLRPCSPFPAVGFYYKGTGVMKKEILILLEPGGEPKRALLTTEHSSSSYGLPVVVYNGEPLGITEMHAVVGLAEPGDTGDKEAVLAEAMRAGYVIQKRGKGK